MKRLILAAVVALGLVWGGAALAQSCGERGAILRALEAQYREQLAVVALSKRGTVMEIAVSPTGSWTVLLTIPGGVTCLVDSGEGFQILEAKPKGQDS